MGDAQVPPTGDGIYEDSKPAESVPVEQGRKLIRKVSIQSETDDQDALLSDLEARVAALGGYIQNKTVNNSQSGWRSANLVLRIPADKLDAFVNHVEGATNILSVNETAEDITLNYIATQSRLSALETEQSRLLELLSQARNLDEILRLESRLTDVRTELEKHRSQLNVYNNLVDYATVNLSITEVKEYTQVEEEEPSVWQRIGSGFVKSVQGVWTIVRELFVFFIIAMPYLLLVAVVAVVVILITRKSKTSRTKRNAKREEETE
jgi:uncharacterized protein YeeX (DUF496 family)